MAGIDRNTSIFTKAYTSFSGADITIFINGDRIWTAQSVSYSITREKAPIYVLGSADPVNFSRGKRGIAGSLIFSSVATDAMGTTLDASEFAAKDTELAFVMDQTSSMATAPPVQSQDAEGNFSVSPPGNASLLQGEVRAVAPIYYDQLLPFDIVIMGANEYFQLAQMVIYGVEILTVGSGLSIDDTSNETQMSFVAKHISRWKPVMNADDPGFDFEQYVTFDPNASADSFGGLVNDGGFS